MIQELKQKVEEIFANIDFPLEPKGLYDPLRYMIGIGGKRIRPLLCLLSYSLYKEEGKELDEHILYPTQALEVFHTFTLIHDDIMDKSPLRRGQSTVWKKWNEDSAILSGDVMLIDAYKRMAKAPAFCFNEALDLFSTTAAQVCEGQQYDMDFEQREDVSLEEYEQMIGLKTAVLLACCAKMGALLAGATKAQCEALYDYGYQLGMAFQIADDYLDAFGEESVFGKPIGGDILQQKKSWLTIDACAYQKDFLQIFKTKDIEKVKSKYCELEVDKRAKLEIEKFSSKAIESLKASGLDDAKKEILKEFAHSLIKRAK